NVGGWDTVTGRLLPAIEYTGVNQFILDLIGTFTTATFAMTDLNGASPGGYRVLSGTQERVIIEGDDAFDDKFTLRRLGGNVFAETFVSFGNVTKTLTFPFGGPRLLTPLQFKGLGGDDLLTVDASIADPVLTAPITFDGGLGSDTLIVSGTPATTIDEVIYTPGPAIT